MNAVASAQKLPLMGSACGPVTDIYRNKVLWGGYHICNVEAFPEENKEYLYSLPRSICFDCQGLARNAVQTACVSLLCEDCSEYRTLTTPPGRLCHICTANGKPATQEHIDACKVIEPFPFKRRAIDKFYLKCPFTDCQWQGTVAELFGIHESEHLMNASPVSPLKHLCRTAIQRRFGHNTILLSECCAVLRLPQGLQQYLANAPPGYTPSNRSAKAYVEKYFVTSPGLLVCLLLNNKDRVMATWSTVVEDPSDADKKRAVKRFIREQALDRKAVYIQFYYHPKKWDPACEGNDTVAESLRWNCVHWDACDDLAHIDGVTLWKVFVKQLILHGSFSRESLCVRHQPARPVV
ncbi:hypothetical protein [Salinisphaera sp. G21_0]|uniref:hypothetical protein n=1 Tax=Salinisphaera sp. G21_0 TaxID=2821094 RepID=UPI001ADA0973|nr:hypothetical protein [Salinisphaera sp. G21_0]MBO9480670.1 hypothetical protein [Salinisphaera sp. G21_0]